MTTPEATIDAVADLVGHLTAAGVRVVVEGGAALILQGWPLDLADVDLVIPCDAVELWDALDVLGFLGWAIPPGSFEYAWQHQHLPLPDGPLRVDLSCADRTDALRRGRHFDYGRLMAEAVRVGRLWCHAWPAVLNGKRERGVVKDAAVIEFLTRVELSAGPADGEGLRWIR